MRGDCSVLFSGKLMPPNRRTQYQYRESVPRIMVKGGGLLSRNRSKEAETVEPINRPEPQWCARRQLARILSPRLEYYPLDYHIARGDEGARDRAKSRQFGYFACTKGDCRKQTSERTRLKSRDPRYLRGSGGNQPKAESIPSNCRSCKFNTARPPPHYNTRYSQLFV